MSTNILIFDISRAQTESVTFLGNHSENTKYMHDNSKLSFISKQMHHSKYFVRNLYAIPGLDYVAHEDILPYKTSETNPLQVRL